MQNMTSKQWRETFPIRNAVGDITSRAEKLGNQLRELMKADHFNPQTLIDEVEEAGVELERGALILQAAVEDLKAVWDYQEEL